MKPTPIHVAFAALCPACRPAIPGADIHLVAIPVWTGAWKIGTHPCGYCGSTAHGWLDCTSPRADREQQARARERKVRR